MYVGPDATYPIMGALYHPPGGIIRHDAVVWGLARGADAGGAEIHPYTEVTGLERAGDRITAVETNRGAVAAGTVLNCTAGWSSLIGDMAGVALPITTHILQACVTEPVKPFLDKMIVSSQMHVYISQSDRGEFVMGSEIEPWTTYRTAGTLNFLQDLTRHTLELFPQLEPHGSFGPGRACATSGPTTARSSAARRLRTSTSARGGEPTASRRRRSSARRWPSWSRRAAPRT